ncbi:Copper amine oxidase N-terminal domain-containing protein [Paenibacillus sp. cl6col]|uniref:stalk domain-containing protein n=1 Tax=Paenibacillus sp. cl6col TaxID=1761878 RepID=UPI0008839023|nr:stalk domain-containing protein [Paenibacillus sp. cl6col]SDE50382.1 Copper amine oxidase N-terminal domain-containing protein [Paenibacillus sp. cl6col]
MRRTVHAGKWVLAAVLSLGIIGVSNASVVSAEQKSSNAIQEYGSNSLVKKDKTYWVWGNYQAVPTQLHGIGPVTRIVGPYVVTDDKKVWYLKGSAISPEIKIHPVSGINDMVFWNGDLAIDADGKVYIVADEDNAQFKELSGIDQVEKIAAYSPEHPNPERWFFLKKDGTVWEGTNKLTSFEKVASLPQVKSVASGLVLKKDGTVWSWPLQFPEGSTPAPSQVDGLAAIRSIYSNREANLAIDAASRLWFWGGTWTGVSDVTTVHDNPKPIQLKNISDVKEAYVVERSIIALTNGGNVYQASIETESMSSGAKFELIASNISSVKAGWRHIIMQKADGSLWGWGVNNDADLGNGDYEFMHAQAVPVHRAVSLVLNGETVKMNNGVVIRNGQAFVPIRSIFEKLGATIKFDILSKVVTVSRSNAGTGSAELTIDVNYKSGTMTLNGKEVQLDNKPFAIKGTSYLPLRFISEKLGAKAEWVQKEDKISITMK